MNKYSGYETCRVAALPYEQLEPPCQLPLAGGSLTAAARKWVESILHYCRDEFLIARTIALLSKLDDRQLNDIGIDRERISVAARQLVGELRASG